MMEDFEERNVGGITIKIDRTMCSAYESCSGIAPEAFELGEDGVITFRNPEQVDRATLIEACEACPVDALLVFDEDGNQIV